MTVEGEPEAFSLILIELQSVKTNSRRSEKDAGNRPLGQVVDAIKKTLRGDDLLCRYGADEFVVLLTHTDRQGAIGVADRIAVKIAEQSSGAQTPEDQRLAVALGVASAPADGTSVEALVSVARGRERGGPNSPSQNPPSVH